MIKFALAALWICAVSVGTLLYSFEFSQARKSAEPPPAFFGGLDHVSTNIISIPVIKSGQVDGYFLTRLSYTIDSKMAKDLSVPLKVLLVDEIYTHLYANPQIDYATVGTLDVETFRDGLRTAINQRVGAKLIHDVLIEQADYLSKAEIRDNTVRRRIGPDETVPAQNQSPSH